jgi:hypothetical protein
MAAKICGNSPVGWTRLRGKDWSCWNLLSPHSFHGRSRVGRQPTSLEQPPGSPIYYVCTTDRFYLCMAKKDCSRSACNWCPPRQLSETPLRFYLPGLRTSLVQCQLHCWCNISWSGFMISWLRRYCHQVARVTPVVQKMSCSREDCRLLQRCGAATLYMPCLPSNYDERTNWIATLVGTAKNS